MANKPTLQDTLDALKIFTGKKEFDAMYDVSGDGKVDLTDVMGLQKAYLGKDPGFAFSGDSFSSPSTKTAADYAAEEQANQERIAAEQKETERRQTLLADAQKINGRVNSDLVANNPNLNAQQLSSLAQRNYWSNESEAFSRVMSAMENGTAQLKQVQTGYMDETGNPETELRMVAPDGPPGYNSLTLRATPRKGVYQFSTPNQVAGGMIHGVIQADPKTGQYAPVQDYTKQIQYTPGQSGSFFGNLIGDLGDMYKSLGPIAPLIGNAIAPGLGSALSAVAALDEGNTTGAILSGLSGAGAYGADAAQNALAAEVSGNADLASQYSSGLGGTLAQNLPEIKTATNAAQLANAVQTGNVGGALTAAGNLTGVSADPAVGATLKTVGLVQALDSGNTAQALVLAGQLTDNPDVKVAGDALKLINGINTGNAGAVQSAATNLAKITGADNVDQQTVDAILDSPASKITSDAGGILNSDEVVAGTQQLIDAITNPSSTASYSGTQLADAGRAGDPGSGVYWDSSIGAWRVADQATDEDLEQLGVGLATDTGTGTDTKTDTQTADQTDTKTATGTTLTGADGNTLTINSDGSVITGGTTAQPNIEYHADGSYTVTYEDGTSTVFNADGTLYSTKDDTGTNTISVFADDTSPSGFRDSLGNPVNADGTPYVAQTTGTDTLTGGSSTVTGAGTGTDTKTDTGAGTGTGTGTGTDTGAGTGTGTGTGTDTGAGTGTGTGTGTDTKTDTKTDTGAGTGTGTGTGTSTKTSTGTGTGTGGTPSAPTAPSSSGLDLNALLALLGASDQQKPPSIPLVDIGEQLDLEAPLQTNPFAKKQTQSKMAEGGSIDDLLALLQQRG